MAPIKKNFLEKISISDCREISKSSEFVVLIFFSCKKRRLFHIVIKRIMFFLKLLRIRVVDETFCCAQPKINFKAPPTIDSKM